MQWSLQLGHWPLLPVVAEARVVGLLPQRWVTTALARPGTITVAQVMLPAGPPLDADADLWSAQQALADAALDALPVYDGEQLHGLLTAADIRATLLEPSAMLHIQPSQLISAGQPSL